MTILIGLALVFSTPIPGQERGIVISGTFATLTGSYLLLSRHWYIYSCIRSWKRIPDSLRPTTMSIDDQHLRRDTGITTTTLTGESIVKVRDFGDGFLIYLSRSHFFAVPGAAFVDSHTYCCWIDAIRELGRPETLKEGW